MPGVIDLTGSSSSDDGSGGSQIPFALIYEDQQERRRKARQDEEVVGDAAFALRLSRHRSPSPLPVSPDHRQRQIDKDEAFARRLNARRSRSRSPPVSRDRRSPIDARRQLLFSTPPPSISTMMRHWNPLYIQGTGAERIIVQPHTGRTFEDIAGDDNAVAWMRHLVDYGYGDAIKAQARRFLMWISKWTGGSEAK